MRMVEDIVPKTSCCCPLKPSSTLPLPSLPSRMPTCGNVLLFLGLPPVYLEILKRFYDKGQHWLKLQGQPKDKGAMFSFTMENAGHAHDISTILDKKGVAVRAGQHCAGPLMDHMGITASCRASFAFYNTKSEVDVLVDALCLANDLFG